MAPKRNTRNIQGNSTIRNYNNLVLNDVLCPICRTILIEPVTLPCNHGFCLSCFNNSMENTNLVCPLCRLRISSWFRHSKKDNKLVNSNLWKAIQNKFAERVEDKLKGEEECEADDVQRHIASDGEIRLEYELQKAKALEEQQKENEIESKASQDLIKKLREQEENDECARNENLRLSEQLAKKLANEYCFDPGPSSSKTKIVLQNNKKQVHIDRFLKNVQVSTPKEYTCKVLNQNTSSTTSFVSKDLFRLMSKHAKSNCGKVAEDTSDSNDSIASECRYFKPINRKLIPVSASVPVKKIPAVIANASTVIIGAPKGKTNFIHSPWASAFAVVRILFPVSTTSHKTNMEIKSSIPTSSMETTITKVTVTEPHSTKSGDKLLDYVNRRPSARPLISSSSNINKSHPSATKSNKVDVMLQSISKRKRTVSSPTEERVSNKHTKVSDIVSTSPVISNALHHLENINCNSNDFNKVISNTRHQEEEDFKLAMELHKELNHLNQYSTRNNVSVPIKNTRRSTKQVTLKEIISQAATT